MGLSNGVAFDIVTLEGGSLLRHPTPTSQQWLHSAPRGKRHETQRKKSGLSANSTSYCLWNLGPFISLSKLYFAYLIDMDTHMSHTGSNETLDEEMLCEMYNAVCVHSIL